jgi:hypothetical protein
MHCLSPLSERTASPQPWQSESHVPPSQAGQGTLNCVQFRSVARTHLENVGFRFHSLRHPTASKFLGGEPGSLKKGSDHGLWRVMPCERSFREFAPTPSPRLH